MVKNIDYTTGKICIRESFEEGNSGGLLLSYILEVSIISSDKLGF
jgi:hypothetical protein